MSKFSILVVISILSALTEPALSQERQVKIFGYFEPQIAGFLINGKLQQIQTNKLRIDLEADVSDKIKFKANYDYITYHGQTEFDILDYLHSSIKESVPVSMQDLYILPFNDRNFLDNIFLKIALKKFDLTIGKQQISLGTGYAWNPTDIYNMKNILDPTYEQPGHNALRVDIPFSQKFSTVLLYSPGNSLRNSSKLIRFKGRFGHFDYSVVGAERSWTLTDFTTFIPSEQNRRLIGGDLAGELFGLGVWAEAAYNYMELDKDYFEGLFGMDYTFESELYVMSEYFWSEQGKSDYKKYDINDWMRYFYSEIKAVCAEQLFTFISYPAADLLTVGGSVICCLNDGSFALVPQLIYNFEENIDITLFGNFYIGSEGKSFSSDLGSGGLLRFRYYF